jgi:5-hydroxyisourate hydrolase-like protein (transthyretin family)
LIFGRVTSPRGSAQFPITGGEFPKGNYRIVYHTKPYYEAKNLSTFYPYIEIVFEKTTDENEAIVIPALFSPYGFSAYKGSTDT